MTTALLFPTLGPMELVLILIIASVTGIRLLVLPVVPDERA